MRTHARLNDRHGISPVAPLAILSIVAVAALAYLAMWLRPDARSLPGQLDVIRVYCASGVAAPIERALAAYQSQFGTPVEVVRTGGSGRLFGQIQTEYETGLSRGADLYVTADAELLDRGHRMGVIAERLPLAAQRAVIAARVDADFTTSDLSQLVTDASDVRFGIANEHAAIGGQVRQLAARQGVLQQLLSRRKVETENVMQLAQALQTKTLDAAAVWDATVAQVNQQFGNPVLRIVAPVDATDEAGNLGQIAVGVMSSTTQRQSALRVARFLAAGDGGIPFLRDAGFRVVDQRRVGQDR